MNDFAKPTDSKEFKIKRLNGWLRFSVWVILFLVTVGTILGILYWRRTARSDASYKQARETAVELIVKAIKVSDSLDEVRHRELMRELHYLHPGRRMEPPQPSKIDEQKLYRQLEQKPEEKK